MKRILYFTLFALVTVSLQAQIDRSIKPISGASPSINLGKPKTFNLPNGLKVLVVENHKLPRVSFTLRLDNPPLAEGDIKGVDALASMMMGNGTSKISKDDFNEELDFYGATAGFDLNGFRGASLSRYFPKVLTLAAQGGLDPLFVEEELNSERAKLLDDLKVGEKSVAGIAKRVQSSLVYGKEHPYGEYITEETVKNVTLNDVLRRYKESYVPQNAYLIVVGDINFEEVKKLVTQNFSSWKKGTTIKGNYPMPTNLSEVEINFVDVSNAVQSEVSVNNIVHLKMADPDYFAAMLANQIIGGGAEGRLFKNLRETHGWTYGAYSGLGADRYVTSFSASASVRNAVTDSAVVEMLNEMRKINETLPTQEELDLVKAKYIGSFVMNAEKPQVVAGFAVNQIINSLPAKFYQDYIKNVNSVTLEQVQNAAKRYILANNARIVIAGKASEVLDGLELLNIPIKYFDKYGNPTERPQEQAVDTSLTSKVILEKYISAIGGEEKLRSIKTLFSVAKTDFQGQEMIITKKETTDGKSLQEMTLAGKAISKSIFDGQNGFTFINGEKQELNDEDAQDIKGNPFPELSLLSTDLKIDGIQNINGTDAYKLVNGNKAYYFAIESGLKVVDEVIKKMGDKELIQQISYDDYREIDGIKIPHKVTINVGMSLELEISEVKFNEGVINSDFI